MAARWKVPLTRPINYSVEELNSRHSQLMFFRTRGRDLIMWTENFPSDKKIHLGANDSFYRELHQKISKISWQRNKHLTSPLRKIIIFYYMLNLIADLCSIDASCRTSSSNVLNIDMYIKSELFIKISYIRTWYLFFLIRKFGNLYSSM